MFPYPKNTAFTTYTFGSIMASVSKGEYRYSFNGKETDNETGLQDYGFRIYNPSYGKFLSVDPLFVSFPWYTPYQFAGNKPIACIDLEGLQELNAADQTLRSKKYRIDDEDIAMSFLASVYSYKTSKGNDVVVYRITHIFSGIKEVQEKQKSNFWSCNPPKPKIKKVEVFTEFNMPNNSSGDYEKEKYKSVTTNCFGYAFNTGGIMNEGIKDLLSDNYKEVNSSKKADIGVFFSNGNPSHAIKVAGINKEGKKLFSFAFKGSDIEENVTWDRVESVMLDNGLATVYHLTEIKTGKELTISINVYNSWGSDKKENYDLKGAGVSESDFKWYKPNEK
jgi:RHS repeat-associated protein